MKTSFRASLWLLPIPFLLAACQSQSGGKSAFGGFNTKPREKWTILCQEFSGPYHRRNCEVYAATLRRTPEIQPDEVYCHHDYTNRRSLLCYGTYYREVDAQTGALSRPTRLIRDIQLIQDLGDQGRRHFAQARMTPAPTPNVGPSQWSLSNADGVYSLQVAVFYPEGKFRQYKQAALEYVGELRRKGYEAYYYHGVDKSIVTVGNFGEDAVVKVDQVNQKYSAEVEALRRRDPRFQYNYENGQVRHRKMLGYRIKSPSFLVPIPRPGY